MLEFIVVAVLIISFLEYMKGKKRLNHSKVEKTESSKGVTTWTSRNDQYPLVNTKPENQIITSKVKNKKVDRIMRLAGVTFEGRQKLIAETKINENIRLKREPRNPYDKNAINVYDSKNRSLGWVPREIARELAPIMDKRIILKAEIIKKTGKSYPKGLEIRVYSQ